VPGREAYRAAEIAALASHALPNCDFWEADMPKLLLMYLILLVPQR
jgi:hypothetical protein